MDLEELKAKLESLEKGSELYEAVVTLINEEKDRGISAKHKANTEAQKLRSFKKSLEALGFDGDSDEVDSFTASLIDKLAKKGSDDENKLTLKSLQKQLNDEKNRSRELETRAKTKTMVAKLTNALSNKVYGSKYLINSLISEGRVDLQGDKVIFKDGEDVMSFDTGISKVLEENKEMVRTSQTPGSGTKNSTEIPQNIASIIESGDKGAIRENLAEIKKSLGIEQ